MFLCAFPVVQALLTRQLCGGSRCAQPSDTSCCLCCGELEGHWELGSRLAVGNQAKLYSEGIVAFSSLSQFLMLLLI